MLLNYLYSNFLEEASFAPSCGVSVQTLTAMINARVFPTASYVYHSSGRSVSFVSDFDDDGTYRFHLKGQQKWFETIQRFGLDTEDRAHSHFFQRYDAAEQTFLSGGLGQQLASFAPDIPKKFDGEHAIATWNHFLGGVYGVCTRDGQPETVFLKQAGVMFIEKMIAKGPGSLSAAETALLERAVALLDDVESDFAAHEVAQSSRQRCIVDVRSNFLSQKAA